MRFPKTFCCVALGLLSLGALFAFQRPFREYPGVEYSNFPLPPELSGKNRIRLRAPDVPTGQAAAASGGFRAAPAPGPDRHSSSGPVDYPRADYAAIGTVRARRLHASPRPGSVEQPVNLDDGDDVFNYPWLYAVQVGQWRLTDPQAAKLREYLLRGGFFAVDDFWGQDMMEKTLACTACVASFPTAPSSISRTTKRVLHLAYDVEHRYQVPGARYLQTGSTEKCYNCPAQGRGIYDDRGRLMVAMSFQSDLGDSWEWADDPAYDEKFSALSIRLGVNYIIYSMTH